MFIRWICFKSDFGSVDSGCFLWSAARRTFYYHPAGSMLTFMRALPGSDSRTVDTAPAPVTRANAAADQRRRILRAVGELVAKRGYEGVTMELVVKRARVSYKTFYKHFSSVEECFIAFFDDSVESVGRAIRDRLAEKSRPWPEQVVIALGLWIDRILAEPLIARAVIVEAPTVGAPLAARYEAAVRAFVPLFRAGRELNPRGADLPETIEDTLAGSVFWSAYQRLVAGEPERLRELLPELAELVLRTHLGQEEAARIARGEVASMSTAT